MRNCSSAKGGSSQLCESQLGVNHEASMAFGALVRQWIVWKAAWEAESGQPLNSAVPEGPAAEFLPEVLDIQQTPPSPIGRTLLWTMLLACAAGTVWAMLGRVDSVKTVHGRVISSGDSKSMHPSEAGVLTAIHVRNGQAVKQGDVLIELDSTRTIAERDRIGKEYRVIQVEAARLRALIKNKATLEVPAEADEDEARFQQRLLRDQLAEYQAKITTAQHLVDQRRAAVMQTKKALLRVQAALSRETARTEQSKNPLEHAVEAKTDVLHPENRRIDKGQEEIRQQKKLQQDRAALAEAEQEYYALVSDFQQAKQADLSALETKAALLAQETTKAEQKSGLQRVLSPIDGVVQQLAVQEVGSVVLPAQQMFLVVPLDSSVEVEAQVERKDAEIVRKGQPVEIKFEMFQGAPYGTIPGHVLTGSDDTTSIEKAGLVSPIRVSLARSTIQVGSTLVKLVPGMVVTVAIKTGPRRMIEYLQDSLLESMNKRVKAW